MSGDGQNDRVRLYTGDARQVLSQLPPECIDCVVTSPPYWGLRDYDIDEQYGLEPTLQGYLEHLRGVFAQLHRVLKPTGTVWLNLGDRYSVTTPHTGRRDALRVRQDNRQAWHYPSLAEHPPRTIELGHGLPAKNLLGIPWRMALALQADGWIIRNEIIWHKPNGMPESVSDRLARKHEHLFLLAKHPHYHFNLDPIRRPYTGDRALSRRAHRTASRPHTITTPWPPADNPTRIPAKYDDASAFLAEPGVAMRPGIPHTSAHPHGANPGTVWSLPTRPSRHRHYAAFPIDIPLRCIAAGSPSGGQVLDPFSGSGTTLIAARRLGRSAIGIDLNPAFHQIARQRLQQDLSESRNAPRRPQ